MNALRPFRWLCLAFWLLALVCPVGAANHVVTIQDFSFSPASLTVEAGDSVTWTVIEGTHDTTSGATPCEPDGRWQSDLLEEGQSFTLTFSNAGFFPYFCSPHCDRNMVGSITVNAANQPPAVSLIAPTNSQSFSTPATFTLQANATDNDGSVAQVEFFQNGNSLGADTNFPYSLVLSNVPAGTYTLTAIANDNAGAKATNSIAISVTNTPVSIVTPPNSRLVNAGADVTFTVEAAGSTPIFYQWFFAETPLLNATNTSLLLTDVQTNQSGLYTIVVSNAANVVSTGAVLTVTNPVVGQPPEITGPPVAQSVFVGSNASFTVDAIGSAPLFFQWFYEESPLAGRTNATLDLPAITLEQAGNYFVIISNAFGQATSAPAALVVMEIPVCTYTLSVSNLAVPAAASTNSVQLTAGTNCTWSILNTNPWISLDAVEGNGSRLIACTVATNSAFVARTGLVSIAGIIFTVRQEAALFPAKSDFNKDGFSDFVWQTPQRRVQLWLMNGLNVSRSLYLRRGLVVAPEWKLVGTHDFNADNSVDLLWQHSNGLLAVWYFNGTNFLRSAWLANQPLANKAWRAAGLGDFNGDGQTDIVFRHTQGYVQVWFLKGATYLKRSFIYDGEPVPTFWLLSGVADFNRDGTPDILWRNNVTGGLALWEMAGVTPRVSKGISAPVRPVSWQLLGAPDLNRDLRPDLLWRYTDGRLNTWFLNGTTRTNTANVAPGRLTPGWRLGGPK